MARGVSALVAVLALCSAAAGHETMSSETRVAAGLKIRMVSYNFYDVGMDLDERKAQRTRLTNWLEGQEREQPSDVILWHVQELGCLSSTWLPCSEVRTPLKQLTQKEGSAYTFGGSTYYRGMVAAKLMQTRIDVAFNLDRLSEAPKIQVEKCDDDLDGTRVICEEVGDLTIQVENRLSTKGMALAIVTLPGVQLWAGTVHLGTKNFLPHSAEVATWLQEQMQKRPSDDALVIIGGDWNNRPKMASFGGEEGCKDPATRKRLFSITQSEEEFLTKMNILPVRQQFEKFCKLTAHPALARGREMYIPTYSYAAQNTSRHIGPAEVESEFDDLLPGESVCKGSEGLWEGDGGFSRIGVLDHFMVLSGCNGVAFWDGPAAQSAPTQWHSFLTSDHALTTTTVQI